MRTFAWLLALSFATAVHAEPRITRVAAQRDGGTLVCRIDTEGMPGERILSTLASGLESAVEIRLTVIDDRDRAQLERDYLLRLSFNLWEEVYSVRVADEEVRFPGVEQLRGYLAELPGLRVAPLHSLDGGRYRIDAGLKLHALAPDERGRVQSMVSGEVPSARASDDGGQEFSVSMGRLIRFFYGGERGRSDLTDHRMSASFTAQELRDVQD